MALRGWGGREQRNLGLFSSQDFLFLFSLISILFMHVFGSAGDLFLAVGMRSSSLARDRAQPPARCS